MNINLTLIGQVGTFLVFWWFVNKYIWPIFAKVAKERQRKIADGLSMANKAKVTVAEAEAKSDQVVADAKAQANEIIAQANKQATQMVEKARADAKQAGDLELSHAKAQIEIEQRQARDELREKLSSLVIAGAEKVVEREIKADDHDKFLHELTEKL